MPKISDLGTLRSGFHLRGATAPQFHGTNHVIQLGDVRDGVVQWDRVIRMDIERARPRDFVVEGDILLRSRGASYGAALVPPCPERTLAAAPLFVLRLEAPGVNPGFLVWFINRPVSQSSLEAHARGTHIPTVSVEAFAGFEVTLPSMAAQARILEMEALFQAERDLTQKHLDRRAELVRAAQEALLTERYLTP